MTGPITKRSKASRFPAARIKKIMQMDEDVGKLASATPVMISKSLECFMQLLLDEASKEARSRGSKKLTAYHLKHTINNTPSFDFLLDIVSRIPDPIHGETGTDGPSTSAGPSRRKPSSSSGPATPNQAGPSVKKRKSKSFAAAASQGVLEESKPAMGMDFDDNDDDREEAEWRPTVRPGLGNLLNPTIEEEVGPRGSDSKVVDEGGSGQAGSGVGGRGMFDDYEDDDDY